MSSTAANPNASTPPDTSGWNTDPKRMDLEEWVPGEWIIDPTHSQIIFAVRHTLVPVRCAFTDFRGTIIAAEHPEDSSVEVVIKTGSFTTGFPYRDARVSKFPDLLAGELFPEITFTSERVTSQGNGRGWIDGTLTARGISRQVRLDTVPLGRSYDESYGSRIGFSATTRLDRRDFGMEAKTRRFEASRDLGDGNHMLGWTIDVEIVVEAVSPTDPGTYGLEKVLGTETA